MGAGQTAAGQDGTGFGTIRPTHWVFLRGLTRSTKHWGTFPDDFMKHLGVGVLMLDLPGCGTQAHERVPLTMGATVRAVRERWLAQRQPGERWGVLGISLGGMVALQWLASHEFDFSHGVVISASSRCLGLPFWRRLRPGALVTILRALWHLRDPLRRETLILALSSSKHERCVAGRWAAIAKDSPTGLTTLVCQLVAAAAFVAPTWTDAHTLVLSGAADRMVDSTFGRRIAARIGGEHAMHPNSGHDVVLDDPGWILTTIGHWLDTRARQAPGPNSVWREGAGEER